jgi:hypothetical protein
MLSRQRLGSRISTIYELNKTGGANAANVYAADVWL